MKAISSVALTGATGFVGRAVCRELLRRGYTVHALLRDTAKGRSVLPRCEEIPGAKPDALRLFVGDATDPAAAHALLHGTQACINLIGIIREVKRLGVTFQRSHVDTTRVLVHAATEAGTTRFIQMSALGARDVGVSAYQHSKYEAELALRRSSLDWTIFRPGLIHGKDSMFVGMVHAMAKGHHAPYVFLPYFTGGREDTRVPLGGVNPEDPRVAPVAVEDVAVAFVASLTNPKSVGEIYNLVGPETMTYPAMMTFMRDNIPGAFKLPAFGIPSFLAAGAAKAAGLVGLGGFLPFDEGMAKMAAEDATADQTKVRDHLNFVPRPFTQVFPRYAAQIGASME